MTTPAPFGDARRTTLTPGASPVLLTEYMPGAPNGALVINTGLAGRVYLGTNSSVSPSTGVPLEGGTALPWMIPGQLWAYLDPATTSVAQDVVLTADIGGWTPSPLALATATALQLATLGVPNVFLQTQVFAGAVVIGNNTGKLAISQYSSLIFNHLASSAGTPTFVQYTIFDVNGNALYTGEISSPANVLAGAWIIPVTGSSVQFASSGSPISSFTVVGTNRPASIVKRIADSNALQVLIAGPFSFVAGTAYALTPAIINEATIPTGLCYIEALLLGAVCKGSFTLTDARGNAMNLIDTNAMPAFAGNQVGRVLCVMPQAITTIQFSCATSAGAVISAFLRIIPVPN